MSSVTETQDVIPEVLVDHEWAMVWSVAIDAIGGAGLNTLSGTLAFVGLWSLYR